MSASAAPALGAETISGTVRQAITNQPLASIDLDVFDETGASVTVTGGKSDSVGQYSITLPGPGTYVVRADPSTTQPYGAQYYDNTPLKSQATALVVGAGAALTSIDFSLPTGALLTGSVASGGQPLIGIDIDVFADNGEFLSSYPATTLADGTYTVGALPAGQYYVRADPDAAAGQMYVRRFYGGLDIASATLISVGSSDVSGIDIVLDAGGTIDGTVTDQQTGAPLAGLDLDLFDSVGAAVDITATTAADGTYQIGAVVPGNYTLRVDPTVAQGYARTYYVNAAVQRDAMPVQVTAGNATTSIDFTLVQGGTISGTIERASDQSLLADIDLDLFDSNGNLMAGYTTKSDASGAYELGPVIPGFYAVRADPSVASGLAEQFYSGKIDIGAANLVAVTGGNQTANVDFSLVVAGSITGAVGDEGIQPLAGIDLDLFDSTGRRMRKGASSAADGTYDFSSLAPGTYYVRADPTAAQGYARTYYDGKIALAVSDPVVVVGGSATSGIDLLLPLGSSITGQVSDSSGVALANVPVHVLESRNGSLTELDESSTTDLAGAYALNALPPGDYLVRAEPDPGLSAPVYYGDTTDDALATVLTLGPGQNAAAIDIKLPYLASAAQCGDPAFVALSSGAGAQLTITASDALATLRSAVGLDTCALCTCDVDDSGAVTASDALAVLAKAVGRSISLHCPVCA